MLAQKATIRRVASRGGENHPRSKQNRCPAKIRRCPGWGNSLPWHRKCCSGNSCQYGVQSGAKQSPGLDMHQINQTVAPERRRRIRVRVHWQLCFPLPDSSETVDTITQDLSSDGFYCQINSVFIPGEIRTCILNVPTHHPNGGDLVRPVLCRVRIIRVESLGKQGLYGVGCRIEDYCFLAPANGSACQMSVGIPIETPRE